MIDKIADKNPANCLPLICSPNKIKPKIADAIKIPILLVGKIRDTSNPELSTLSSKNMEKKFGTPKAMPPIIFFLDRLFFIFSLLSISCKNPKMPAKRKSAQMKEISSGIITL